MPSQEKHKSIFGATLEWYRNRRGAFAEGQLLDQSILGASERPQMSSCLEAPVPRHFFDASLLFRCMDMLQIDGSELASDDPLLFRELQGVCALCRSKEECWQGLAHEFDDARWNSWREYCPNSAMLTLISAVYAANGPHYQDARSNALSHLC